VARAHWPGDLEPGDLEPGDLEPGDLEPGDLEPGDLEAGDIEAGDIEAGARAMVRAPWRKGPRHRFRYQKRRFSGLFSRFRPSGGRGGGSGLVSLK
jgi:hypothetical protein